MQVMVAGIGMVASIAAAALWLRASLIQVPDNLDTFIPELQRACRWNSYGAMAAVAAAACAAIGFGSQLIYQSSP